MTCRFRAAVDGVVLGGSDGFEVCGVVALQAFHEGYAEVGGEVGIFAVGLLAAAPAWIAEDIDVGRPDGESVVDGVDVVADGFVVLGAGLGPDDGGDLVDERRVPSGGHADGLGEESGVSRAGDTVEALTPIVV